VKRGRRLRTREHYYGEWQYNTAGIQPFLDHVLDYAKRERSRPITKAPSIESSDWVFFDFSDALYVLFLKNPEKMKKPYESALKYGFRGFSKGGRNGILLIRSEDKRLLAAVGRLAKRHQNEIEKSLGCGSTEMAELRGVKVVHHNPSGERMIGLLNEKKSRVIFLGFARY
jgi:hypothetical protein